MSEPFPPPSGERPGGGQPQSIAAAITEVSERATLLVREEIELAKAEVSEKATKLVKGAIVGAAAGIFFLTALVFVLVGCAWLLYFYLPVNDFAFFWGFFAMAVILVFLGVIAGLIAAKVVKKSSPPVPNMAIEEARKIREAVSSPPSPAVSSPPSPAFGSSPSSAFGSSPSPAFGSSPDPAVSSPPSPDPDPAPAGEEGLPAEAAMPEGES